MAQNNGPRIYELKQAIHSLSKGDDSVSALKVQNFEIIPTCSCRALKVMLEHQQRNWVLKFLMGLNDSIIPIKIQIILIKPLPCLSEVYTLVQQEEKGK